MKSVPRLIRRAVGLLFLCFVLLVAVNLLLLGLVASTQMENARPWSTAEEISATLSRTEDGYVLSAAGRNLLRASGAWAMLID